MSNIIQILIAGIGSIGFGITFRMQKNKLFLAGIGGALSWIVYLIFKNIGCNEYLCAFIASVLTCLYSERLARIYKSPANIFVMTCTIPLIPGAALFRSLDFIIQHQYDLGFQQGRYALYFAASVSAGIVISSFIVKFMHTLKEKRRVWN